jgi:hypothetical protein
MGRIDQWQLNESKEIFQAIKIDKKCNMIYYTTILIIFDKISKMIKYLFFKLVFAKII